jgi:DNA-directed RNA polymerase subunit RPC12/RpoP
MENTVTSSTIICPQCGGENTIPADSRFLECQFCGSSIFIDKSKVVNHYVVLSNFDQNQAIGNVRRWMAGNFHVKDLDKNAQIAQTDFYYFPMWYFKTVQGGADKIYLQPAHSTPISEIKNIQIPAGNLKVYHKKDFDEKYFVTPDVLFESAKSWLEQAGVNTAEVAEANLVHIPFYQVHYNYEGKPYSAMVEASSGKVYANIWPAKKEAPFRMMFAASIIFFVLASILSFVIGIFIAEDVEGLFYGEMIKIPAYILTAIPLIIVSYYIAKKV